MSTGMTTLVRSVSSGATVSAVMLNPSGSLSASTGVASKCSTMLAVAQ